MMDAVDGLNNIIEGLREYIESRDEHINMMGEDIIDLTIENNKYRDRLEEAVDLLTDLSIITNTPYAKRKWIEGE